MRLSIHFYNDKQLLFSWNKTSKLFTDFCNWRNLYYGTTMNNSSRSHISATRIFFIARKRHTDYLTDIVHSDKVTKESFCANNSWNLIKQIIQRYPIHLICWPDSVQYSTWHNSFAAAIKAVSYSYRVTGKRFKKV